MYKKLKQVVASCKLQATSYKSLTALVGLLVVLFFAYYFFFSDSSAQLFISYPDGKVRVFSGETRKNMTILDALFAVSEASGTEVLYEVVKNKTTLTSIDGLGLKKFLVEIRKNGKLVSAENISLEKVSHGDRIELKMVNSE